MGNRREQRKIALDEPLLDPEEWRFVIRKLRLSRQQARVLQLVVEGKRDKEVAAQMELRFSTVRTYLHRMFLRFGVEDRVGLLRIVFMIWRKSEIMCQQRYRQQKCRLVSVGRYQDNSLGGASRASPS